MIRDSINCRGTALRRGLTLVEMAISIPLVGMVLVVALNTVGASKVAQFKVGVGREGYLMAQSLMSEILRQDYADVAIAQQVREAIRTTGSATLLFGADNNPGRNEVASADWSLFNDVDDYDGWSASPPQRKDGTVFPKLNGWKRSVSVVYTSMDDLIAVRASDLGCKRITVSVSYNDVPAAELVALKTIGLPWLEACCFDGGSCEDLRVEACAVQGGTDQGPRTNCAGTECPTGPAVLFVVIDPANLTTQETAKQTLIESWDFSVDLIAASAPGSAFDTAVATVDVAYIPVEIAAGDLGTKLTTASIGVVNTNPLLLGDLGYSSGTVFSVSLSVADVADNTHFITSPFAMGPLTLSTSDQLFSEVVSGMASGAQVLATIETDKDSLLVFETGALLVGATPAPGRRVQLLWGDASFDFNALTVDARTIMKRALEWAAGMDVVCGNGNCDVGEDPCNCPADCGAPTAFEQPGATCNDGMDNDCDGATDCADINCPTDPACQLTLCGNGMCEAGEDCNTCSTDCPGLSTGKPSGRYCCGNGVDESAEGDGSICDGNY